MTPKPTDKIEIKRLHKIILDATAAALEHERAHNKRLLTQLENWDLIEMNKENQHLRALLRSLHWKSIDKDNMEFECRTTCYVMDEIIKALAKEGK